MRGSLCPLLKVTLASLSTSRPDLKPKPEKSHRRRLFKDGNTEDRLFKMNSWVKFFLLMTRQPGAAQSHLDHVFTTCPLSRSR